MAKPQLTSNLEEDEIVPDSELEFEDLENEAQNESSGDSSDDFVPEESDVQQDEESDVPLRATLNTPTRPSSFKAGSSSKTLRGRKLSAMSQSEADSSNLSDPDDSFVANMSAPRRKEATTTRGKGRRNAVQRRHPGPRRRGGKRSGRDESDELSEDSDGLLEPSDDDAKPPPKGLQPHETLALIKAAQRRMRKKLGRKLTIVRLSIIYSLTLTIVLLVFSVTSRQYNSTSFTQN